MMLWKCYTQYVSKFGKLSSGYRTGKCKFSFQSQRRAMPKNANYYTMALISHASKVMLKILQARLQQFVNQELPDVQAGFRNSRGTRDQIANIRWIIEKERIPEKTSTSASLTTLKLLTCVDHSTLGRFFKRWNSRPPYLPPEKSVCRSRSNS